MVPRESSGRLAGDGTPPHAVVAILGPAGVAKFDVAGGAAHGGGEVGAAADARGGGEAVPDARGGGVGVSENVRAEGRRGRIGV